jgi:hypothetical protein
MFPTRMFGDRYFAPRYFPKVGATPAAPTGQSPAAMRYRYGYREHWVTRLVLLVIGV